MSATVGPEADSRSQEKTLGRSAALVVRGIAVIAFDVWRVRKHRVERMPAD